MTFKLLSEVRQGPLALVFVAALLSSCGGDGPEADVAEAAICLLNACRESTTVKTEDVSPRYSVTQNNGSVEVQAALSQSANILTRLQLAPGDSVNASVGDGPSRPTSDPEGFRINWHASFADASEQPRVTINFVRDGKTYPSTVTMPKPMTLVSPRTTINIRRSTGQFDVQLASADPLPEFLVQTKGSCTRQDKSSFELAWPVVRTTKDARDAQLFHVATADLDATINTANANSYTGTGTPPAVSNCTLALRWLLQVEGSVSPSLSRHGFIRAERDVLVNLNYDAQS